MENQAEYITEAMELLHGPSVEIEPARTTIERRAGEFREVEKPAFVKLSTAFKNELPDISGDALKVWLFISLSINRNTSRANPGLRTIASGVNLAVNTVQKAIKELEGHNLLTVNRDKARYNIYEVPEYVSANRAEPTVSNGDTPAKTVSNSRPTVSNSDETVSPSVILNQRNQREPDILDAILKYEKHPQMDTLNDFERAFKFGTLPWYSNTVWDKFAKWVIAHPGWFVDYVQWREGEGKYKAFSNKKIRENPAAFMDTGYPEYEAFKMYRKTDESRPEYQPIQKENIKAVPNPLQKPRLP